MKLIDLRSDTVTRPSPGMRHAMAEAPVGDDVYGEDPSVSELEAYTAELLGKPAALFVPSGTMANQIALLTQTRRGNQVLVGGAAHVAAHEAGAGAAWAGVQFESVGETGLFTRAELEGALTPRSPFAPKPALVCLENTHNLAGGRVFPQTDVEAISALVHQRGLRLHLDGARLWHTAEATALSPAMLAAPADTVSVCFSKGLGAPVGSALVGSHGLIEEARRFRKMLGGGMRQAGILAAGALYALRHHREQLATDHAHAMRMFELLQDVGAEVVIPETNIVMLATKRAELLQKRAASLGVLCHALGPHRVRLVFHRDVDSADVEAAGQIVSSCVAQSVAGDTE